MTTFVKGNEAIVIGALHAGCEALPAGFRAVAHWNPVFYLIDGARFGFLGVSDASPWQGLAVVGLAMACVLGLAWSWLRSGYRMKP